MSSRSSLFTAMESASAGCILVSERERKETGFRIGREGDGKATLSSFPGQTWKGERELFSNRDLFISVDNVQNTTHFGVSTQ